MYFNRVKTIFCVTKVEITTKKDEIKENLTLICELIKQIYEMINLKTKNDFDDVDKQKRQKSSITSKNIEKKLKKDQYVTSRMLTKK